MCSVSYRRTSKLMWWGTQRENIRVVAAEHLTSTYSLMKQRAKLQLGTVYVTGGNTLYPNFAERLRNEVTRALRRLRHKGYSVNVGVYISLCMSPGPGIAAAGHSFQCGGHTQLTLNTLVSPRRLCGELRTTLVLHESPWF